MTLSIIIPNYNGARLLEKNLPHVLAAVQAYNAEKTEIIIPEDPSTDDSVAVIAKFIKSLDGKKIIGKTIENRNKKLAGFSHNVNRGVSLSTGEILVLLNSDVRPYKDFLTPLLEPFKDQNVFACGCLDETEENGKMMQRGRGIGRWHQGFLVHAAGCLDKQNTLWASGGSSAFRKSLWDKLHGLDTIYDPFYWEDIDLSYRALKSGYKIFFVPESRVRHAHDEGVVKSNFSSSYVKKIAYRNQCIFVWKDITQTNLLLSNIFWLVYHSLKALYRGDWPFFQGVGMALMQIHTILQKRARAKKLFIKSDNEVLANYNQ
ncbi:MAG: glycosyltransferase [Patescibacteria group bacterium]